MTKDEKFLKEARDRWKLAESAAEKQRQRELDDLKFYAGEQWDSDLLKARGAKTMGSGSNQQVVPARPSLTINKTIEPVRQILNQERQADLGYELVPADDFGGLSGPIDHTEIELREGLVRRIQRDSEAEDARTWAFQRAAIAGQGYRVVMTRYVPGKRADQEVYIDRIYNQNSVMLDPSHEQPDASDINWGFYGTDMLWDAFVGEYPESKTAKKYTDCTDDEWRALGDEAPGWFRYESQDKGSNRVVRVVNYYYVEKDAKTLYHLSDGSAVYKEELESLPEGVQQETDKDSGEALSHIETKRSVKWCKITGKEILDETDWPGQWVPIIREVGEELQPYDNERRAQGVVRPMRDSCKGNNYIISKFAEQIGLTPIPPWIMAGGQDEGYEDEWSASTTRTIGVLHYNQKDSFNMPVPAPPQRTNVSTDVAGIATGVQIFGQAIQSTSVVPETALGNTDPSVKSGKLARALIEQAEMGTSNFMDNHKRSLRHEARVVNDLLYPIYGRPGRMVQIVNKQGERESILVGQPFVSQGAGKNKRPVPVPPGQPPPENAKLYKLTPDADFNIAIKISKSVDTRRQQIAGVLGELVAASPEQMAIIGDKIWKYLDLPDHEEIEERYQVMLAPPIQKLLAGEEPVPPAIQQKLEQMGQLLEAMTKELEAKTRIIDTDQIKAQQQLAMQHQKNKSDMELERASADKDIYLAKMKIVADLLKTQATLDAQKAELEIDAAVSELDRQVAQAGQRQEIESESIEASRDREHQMSEAERTRQFQTGEAEAQRQQEREMQASQQAQEQQMAQQQAQQHAQQPQTNA